MKQIIKYGKYVIILLILIVIVVFAMQKDSSMEEIIEEPIEQSIEVVKEEPKEEIKKIKVDIKGEVNKPGVYELNMGSRVYDAIKVSGDLTENADTTLLNLSKNLTDEMVIIVYNKYEIEKLKKDLTTTQTVIKYIEKECSCPDTINDACMKKADVSDSKEAKSSKDTASPDNKVSINTASLEELQTIPGIGESKAKAIIEYREKNGGFKDIEELKNISGIGESTFEKFKEYITI